MALECKIKEELPFRNIIMIEKKEISCTPNVRCHSKQYTMAHITCIGKVNTCNIIVNKLFSE
jgi:hypothetical protein